MNQRIFTEKQMRVKLVISAVLIVVGCVLFGLLFTGVISPFGPGTMLMLLATGLMVAGIINYFAGYRSHIKRHNAPKAGKPTSVIALLLVIVGGISAFIVPYVPNFIQTARNNSLDNSLHHYVKTEWSSKNAKVPQNPKFVLYDMDSGRFSYPVSFGIGKEKGLCDNPYAAKNAGEANIAIGYSDGGSSKSGYWYDKNSGKKTEDAFTQKATIYAIRLDDWSLIDQKSESIQQKKGSTGQPARSMVHGYDITYVIKNGCFQN